MKRAVTIKCIYCNQPFDEEEGFDGYCSLKCVVRAEKEKQKVNVAVETSLETSDDGE